MIKNFMENEKKTWSWKIIVGIILILIIIVIAFSTNNNQANSVKVGAILPLTGKEANIGQSMKNALELAKEDINRNGGINSKNLKIIYEDSQSDVNKALSSYQKLTQIEGVKEIFTAISSVVLSIAPIAEKNKILNLAMGSAAPKISEAGDYTFRHNLLPQDESMTLANYIYNSGIKQIPLLVVNTESGVSYRDEFKKDFESLGGKISFIEMYEKGATDYKTQLTKIKAMKPKEIVTLSYAAEMGIQFKQAKELGLNVQWFAVYTAEDPQVLSLAGSAADGIIYTHYYDASSTDPLFTSFNAKYVSEFKIQPLPYSGLAYDFLKVLGKVMNACGEASSTICVKDGLYGTQNYQGVTGSISFDKNGDTKKAIIMKTIKNGQFVKLEN